jgi:SnoaL-like domain
MKIRLLGALVGLAISFALSTFAQQTNSPDPQLRQRLVALIKKYDEVFNKNDAAALAAFFTEDAVFLTDAGPIYGRGAIVKHFADLFQNVHFSNHLGKADQYSFLLPSGFSLFISVPVSVNRGSFTLSTSRV